jgi:hypothetical protein
MRWLAQHRALARRGAAAATVVVLSLGAVACGDDENGARGDRDVKPLGETLAGSVAPLAQCKDWVGGSRERKLATIDDIRAQVSRRDTGIRSPALTDEEALGLFDRACSNRFARSFRLYVLYARAAGFIPLARDR